MFKKLKDKKGFTLVELIVVLVILAILAALLIPSLTGYIDKANKEKVVSETRMVAMAVQTELSEAYGQAGAGKDLSTSAKVNEWKSTAATGSSAASEGAYIKEIKDLAEVFDSNTSATFTATAGKDGTLKTVKYNDGVYTCEYDATKKTYTTAKKTETLDNSVAIS
jgi:type IV pilus assembly protein PilA